MYLGGQRRKMMITVRRGIADLIWIWIECKLLQYYHTKLKHG